MRASCGAARSYIPDASYQGCSVHHSVFGTSLHSGIHREDVHGSFEVSVLHGSPRLDTDQADLVFFCPAQHAARDVNSGPLSERTLSGGPRCSISRSSSRVARPSRTRYGRVVRDEQQPFRYGQFDGRRLILGSSWANLLINDCAVQRNRHSELKGIRRRCPVPLHRCPQVNINAT